MTYQVSTLCLGGRFGRTLCSRGHYNSSYEYIMFMRLHEYIMFMRTFSLIRGVHYVYEGVLGGRYVHEDIMTHRMSTLCL